MESILIFIKHHFGFLWRIIENINDLVFHILYSKNKNKAVKVVFENFAGKTEFLVKKLDIKYVDKLYRLINSQDSDDLKYFKPHGFDEYSIKKQFKKRSFLMMGVFDEDELIGYFFLRFFVNKKCFVGRLIDKDYRGRGIGEVMNTIMYNIAWEMGFRCLSTISKNNKAVIGAHKKNSNMVILKELPNDYLLVEFVNKAVAGER